ncbi:hypothetical protein GLOTRDRAFT_113919 [Gloeophyllum trabeum ATCC 11539]|uniref:BTB domain-containing protein n=1 Tax=Gloeophyllum trabeum (strain ATCC 11539 / FP-39264 / Madison 617) TaxID=670483 RepID=S7QIL5_GLOTA|nr:uncharacterized protein GLOTRDRAFT_113919 [Gloeophyllum trabeum ATCC 11539]EPQ59143.1 hypothetical protein GLOTRDRAFT_113919 [Gloeophyllum trabeum ATCC 11539]
MQEEAMRHWNFTAFEWIVRDVHKLRDFVEGGTANDEGSDNEGQQDDFDIFKESPILGEGKFKLEIADGRTPTLCLFLTSLLVDYAHDYEMSASMMTAIKCQDDRAGERGARADWVWEHWDNDWIFRQEREVWECPLPPLSQLLESPRIEETDSFVICVQIHSPTGPFFPQQSSAYYVPRDLLEGLEASLDNANTGDVRFVCLERQEQPPPSPASPNTSTSRRSSSSCSHGPFHSHITARKRIIFAHSDILTRRSEYFATMLSSAFSENASAAGERKVFTVVVEEADFVTIYWLLKWVYANWLLFKEADDPRVAVDGVGAGWSAKWLTSRGGSSEWDWKTFNKNIIIDEVNRDDARSATSAESARSSGERRGTKGKQPMTTTAPVTPSGSKVAASAKTTPSSQQSMSRTSSSTLSRRTGAGAGPAVGSTSVAIPIPDAPSVSHRTKTVPVPVAIPSAHYPISPLTHRHPPSVASTPDPHPHPTRPPPPASALSMYQVAHRYAMPGLASLALEHIMSTITPKSSFALLLATAVWDELHSFVEDYVVEKWDDVSVSEEFEQCCQEVAAGEWGPEGGKTMMALFRRLRSPSALGFSRP